MTLTPTLLPVNVGLPKNVSWQGRTVCTGMWKQPTAGPAMVRRLNIDGDGQGDTAGHGGEQRAVLVYQIQSYRHWARYFGRDDFGYGAFGENLTVDGLTDGEVCIGDRYRLRRPHPVELSDRRLPHLRHAAVSGIRHKSPIGDWKGGWQPGTDPERRDYASVADFADPDGNTWILQEIGYRGSAAV